MKGSFTGAIKDKSGLFTAAAKGTFFLDEIGETTPATQVKLLRVLQHREVIPVGATDPHADRRRASSRRPTATSRRRSAAARSAPICIYRLNVIALHLPTLRQRADDIPLLAEHFLARIAELRQEAPKTLSRRARSTRCCDYSWPGNVRELENALERAVILTPGDEIAPSRAPRARHAARQRAARRRARTPTEPDARGGRARVHHVGARRARAATRAAPPKCSGIDPSTLYRKLSRYGVEAA